MRKPIAKFEYEGITIEVYNKDHLNTIFRSITKEMKKVHQTVNNHDAREENLDLPTVPRLVETIQKLPTNMEHTFVDLMNGLMNRKLSSTGSERKLYDIFVRNVYDAHKIIEKAQNGHFVKETRAIRENGRLKRTTVFRFMNKEDAVKNNSLPE
jgi:hypothetical protein